jgi:hypothetical protein
MRQTSSTIHPRERKKNQFLSLEEAASDDLSFTSFPVHHSFSVTSQSPGSRLLLFGIFG